MTSTMLKDKWTAMGAWSPLAALQKVADTKWLVDGIIPADSINWLVAAPESFKTFLAMDLATCIASGRDWHGRQTDRAVVLFLAAEGGNDIHVRRAAADLVAGDTGPLCIVQARPRLDEDAGLASLITILEELTGDEGLRFPEIDAFHSRMWDAFEAADETEFTAHELEAGVDEYKWGLKKLRPTFGAWDEAIARWREEPSLNGGDEVPPEIAKRFFVVIDTYSQTSADDSKLTVSRYIKTLRDLQDKARALGGTVTVLVVDHTTKSGESYMGSLAKEGDSDTMLEVARHGEGLAFTLKCAKMKQATKFTPIHLEMQPYTLDGYVDAYGRPLQSLVVGDGTKAHQLREVAGSKGETAATILLALLEQHPGRDESDLRADFCAHPAYVEKKTDSVNRAFRRAFDDLCSRKLITKAESGEVSLSGQPLEPDLTA